MFAEVRLICLIQGSKTDWEEEGEKMGAMYSNSTITLAAESSIDSQYLSLIHI